MGVTLVGSRRQAFMKGLSYQGALLSSGSLAGPENVTLARRFRARISPLFSAAAITSGPILGCSGSMSTAMSLSRSIPLVVGPTDAITVRLRPSRSFSTSASFSAARNKLTT